MKLSEMRALSMGDFDREVQDRKRQLMELRFQAATSQLADSSQVAKLRREVAQLLTVRTELQRAALTSDVPALPSSQPAAQVSQPSGQEG